VNHIADLDSVEKEHFLSTIQNQICYPAHSIITVLTSVLSLNIFLVKVKHKVVSVLK